MQKGKFNDEMKSKQTHLFPTEFYHDERIQAHKNQNHEKLI